MGYIIGGIQQIGIGVIDLEESWKWYIERFGMDCRIFDDDSEAKLMSRYTGGNPVERRAILALNLQSGGGFEVWQYKKRKPLEIGEEIKIGDLGILVCKMKAKNINSAYSFFKENKTHLLSELVKDPVGSMSFFLKDPYGNIFQIIENNSWFMKENKETGGSYGAIIGVSDIEKARVVYSEILGYDEVVYDSAGIFPDLKCFPGGKDKVRRVLLKCSKPFTGHFIRIFGQSVIELVCNLENPGKKTLLDRFWGDPGFIHMCFDIYGIDDLQETCRIKGHPFTVDSRHNNNGNSFDMGEAAGHFAYIEDPDGTLIEFVETHKLPILKKFRWYLDLRKRNAYKPLPEWMVKMLRFSRV
jgi:catechol 2,3-dioxygenase-like lactoylglutathione lyase family enzyme